MDVEKIARVFKPSAPIEDPEYFVGRKKERQRFERAVVATGRHVVLFGERGIGKTSLLKVVIKELNANTDIRVIEYTCGSGDTYEDIFAEFLRQTNQLYEKTQKELKTARKFGSKIKLPVIAEGNVKSTVEKSSAITQRLPLGCRPFTLVSNYCKGRYLFIIDEFDRIDSLATKTLIADTIKILSDTNSPTKIILSGVSNSAIDLIGRHHSIMRNLVSIPLLKMKDHELREIIHIGCSALNLEFSPRLINLIVKAANGLPYFVHLLGEELAIRASEQKMRILTVNDFFIVLEDALNNVLDVIKESFESALEPYSENEFSSYTPVDQVPSDVRQLAIMSLSLLDNFEITNPRDLKKFIVLSNELAASKGIELPSEYQSGLLDNDVEVIFDHICNLSDLIFWNPITRELLFSTAYGKGFSLLQTANYFGKELFLKYFLK